MARPDHRDLQVQLVNKDLLDSQDSAELQETEGPTAVLGLLDLKDPLEIQGHRDNPGPLVRLVIVVQMGKQDLPVSQVFQDQVVLRDQQDLRVHKVTRDHLGLLGNREA